MQRLALALLLTTSALAGCGGASPEDRVRDTARKGLEAVTSDHPERACQYTVDREKCIDSAMTAKALNVDVAAVTGVPHDWRSRLAKAKITVTGATAEISDFDGDGKPGRYVLRDGEWLADNRG